MIFYDWHDFIIVYRVMIFSNIKVKIKEQTNYVPQHYVKVNKF
jgi:hypothetical protein